MGSRLSIALLGRFTVAIDDQALASPVFGHRPAATLVKLLALAPRLRLSSEEVIEQIWPEIPTDRGRTNLRKAVHFARRAMGSADAILVGADSALVLWPGATIVVDVARFEEAARAAITAADAHRAAEAASLYSGELLPDDRYAAWAEAPRERLRALASAVLKMAHQWERALEIDPLDEEAHRGLMREAVGGGNRQAAIRQFERLRDALSEELGVLPDPQTQALYEEVLGPEQSAAPTPAQRARTLLAWGMVHWERQDLDEAERTAREVAALAVDARLGGELGEASALLGLIAQARGPWREFFRNELVGTLERSPELAPFVFDANLCLSEFCLYLPGALPEMATFAHDLDRVAIQSGSAQGRALAALTRGEVALLSGALADSQEVLADAASQQAASAGSATPLALQRLAEAWTWSGQPWRARRLLPRALRLAREGPLARHLVVRVYGAMIESAATAEAAVALIETAEDDLYATDVCQACSIGFRTAAARRLAEGGDANRAAVHLAIAEQIAAMWAGGPWLASVREARGQIARATGPDNEAAELLTEAAALYSEAGFPLHAARCRAARVKAGPAREIHQPVRRNGSRTPSALGSIK